MTEISPARVVITVPCAPIQSPRSSALTSANASSPTTALDTNSWTSTPRSATVRNTSLPASRLSITRPAIDDGDVGLLARAEVGAELAHVGGAVGAVEAVGVGLLAGGAQVVDLSLATSALGGEAAARDDRVDAGFRRRVRRRPSARRYRPQRRFRLTRPPWIGVALAGVVVGAAGGDGTSRP